ncbi:MAG: hypothetical protein KGJ43_03425 [Acidobacteriota bacterium]|nr:hypothetical protein [Acidobacteriota bacterium]
MLAEMLSGGRAGHRVSALTATGMVALLVGGCGGSSKSPGTVSASSYMGQVCTSVASWVHAVQSRAAELERQVAAKPNAAGAKKELEAFVGATIADTETAVNALRSAGVPNVANGKKIASALLGAFERAGATLKSLKPKVAALSATDTAAVQVEAKRVGGTVQALPLDLGTGLAGVNSSELDKAASESDACKRVGARGKA